MRMSKYCFGIDVGGTTIKCALFLNDGTILDKWEIKTNTDNGGERILPDIADGIEDAIKDHDLILLGNHGCIAVGKTLEDAVKIIEAAEEVLKIYHLTKEIGPVRNISDSDLEELYNNHPGSRRNRYGK